MGARGNINVDGVFLYTHWKGRRLPSILQTALKRKQRWNDGPYLCRIIFCEMVKGAEADETGFGISTSAADDAQFPILEIDSANELVRNGLTRKWTFEEFCKIEFKEGESQYKALGLEA